jgi:hypothetical protein
MGPGSGIPEKNPILDLGPGVKKTPDLGSRSAIPVLLEGVDPVGRFLLLLVTLSVVYCLIC